MTDISISDINSYRKLLHTLNILSLHFNITCRVFNGNGFSQIVKIWEKHSAPVYELLEIINQVGLNNNFDDSVDQSLWKWFYPEWNIKNIEEEKQKEARFINTELSKAIWKTAHSVGNPFHDAIIDHFPFVRVFTRIKNIKLLSIAEKEVCPSTLTSPTNLVRGIKKLENLKYFNLNKDFLSIGAVWLEEYFPSVKSDIFELRKEALITSTLDTILNIAEKHNIKHKNLNYSNIANFLTISGMHPTLNIQQLNKKMEVAYKTLQDINSFCIKNYLAIQDIHISEFRSLIQFILFLNDNKTNLLIENQIRKEYEHEDYMGVLTLIKRLSERRHYNIYGTIEHSNKNAKSQNNWYIELDKNNSVDFNGLSIKVKSESCVVKDIDLLETKLNSHIYDFIDKARISRSDYKRNIYERLRLQLKRFTMDDVNSRYELITETSRKILHADKAIYFEYDSIEDCLIPRVLLRSNILRDFDPPKEEHIIEDVRAQTEFIFKKLARQNFENFRNKSSAYRCIDEIKMISRFKTDKYNPFSSTVEDEVQTIDISDEIFNSISYTPEFKDWFQNEGDVLAAPILSHGNRQGVLHLSTIQSHQFLLEDRARMCRFINMVEDEIYNARLLKCLDDIYNILGKAIKSEINEEEFNNTISSLIAKLHSARAATIWWKTNNDSPEVKIVGKAGEKLSKYHLRNHVSKVLTDPFFREVFQNKEIVYSANFKLQGEIFKEFQDLGLSHCIQTPLFDEKNIAGILVLHYNDKINFSHDFYESLRFFSVEVSKILQYFFEFIGRMHSMRMILGHDIDSTITQIHNNAQRLKVYDKFLDAVDRHAYKLRLDDIHTNAKVAHVLFKYLTDDNFEKKIQLHRDDPLIQFYYHLNQNTAEHETNVNDIIKNKLFSSKLRNKNISHTISIGSKLIINIDSIIIDRIVSNIIDNASKYGKNNSKLEIQIEKTSLDWIVKFKSEGTPLHKKARKNTELIFENGKRFLPDENINIGGKGLGLYIARKCALAFGGDLFLEYEHGTEYSKYCFVLSIPIWLDINFKKGEK